MATTRVQSHFRFRNDDGSESAASWKAAADTALSSDDIISSAFTFRLRLNVRQTGTTSATLTARLRVSVNGGAYTQINPAGPVIALGSANLTDDAATTQQISSGTFVAGKVDDLNAQCSATASMAQNRDTEHEFMLQVPAGALNNGDTLDFRIYNTNSALNTYTVTPRLTIVNSGLAVARGAISSAFEQTGGSNLDITDLTIGAQSNKAILVAISWTDGGPPSTPSVTFDPSGVNQAFSLIKYQINGTGRAASLYGLVAPGATGNKIVRIACGGSNFGCFAQAIQYFNVDQTGGTTTFANAAGNTGSGTTVSLSITSSVGCKTIDCFGAATPSGVPTQWLLFFQTGAGAEDGGASEGVGAASITHQWTITTNNWAVAGCSLNVFSSGQTIAVDQASETELSQAPTRLKAKAVSQVSETEAAQDITPVRKIAISQAFETDASQTISIKKIISLTQAIETESSQVITPGKAKATDQASETDSAFGITKLTGAILAQAVESNAAQSFTIKKRIALDLTSQSDTAQSIAPGKRIHLDIAIDTELAQEIQPSGPKVIQLSIAVEGNAAQSISILKTLSITQAIEQETSQALSVSKVLAFDQASEVDAALDFTTDQFIALDQALEHSLALEIFCMKFGFITRNIAASKAASIRGKGQAAISAEANDSISTMARRTVESTKSRSVS